MKKIFIFGICLLLPLRSESWGFYSHMRINQLAIYTVPAGMSRFYKNNSTYLSNHATDADKRRYADTAEAPRHYLDVESYEQKIDSIPRKWGLAVKKYGLARLTKNGILPWQIQRSYYKLVTAFRERDSMRILINSAYLGHYLADAHVPLHTTVNHNGQLTNQIGIHAFWESRLPELFSDKYSFLVGAAGYVNDPLKEAWNIIGHTHQLVNEVLDKEARLSSSFPAYRKFSYAKRKNVLGRQYSFEYSRDYHMQLNHMVEMQMRASVRAIGNYWFSAWVDGGQPVLENMVKVIPDSTGPGENAVELKFRQGRIIGREY
jgi:hypothetical protein